jgi:hypothetical protein
MLGFSINLFSTMFYHLFTISIMVQAIFALPQDPSSISYANLESRDDQVTLPDYTTYFALADSCDPEALCNSADCYGLNFAVDNTYGSCISGMCTGVNCRNSCQSTIPNCPDCSGDIIEDPSNPTNNKWICTEPFYLGCPCNPTCPQEKTMCKDCAGINNQDGSDSICNRISIQTAGPNLGCPCQSSCPTTFPTCDDSVCNGISYADGTGQCQVGPLQGCICSSACPSVRPSCGDPDCGGYSHNSSPGTCLSGKYSGCSCTSTCGEVQEKTCSVLAGCLPLLSQHSAGECTGGRYRGCSCDSQCPLPLIGCRDPKCQGTTIGLCEYGPLIGCQCGVNA